ncbi:MAG TPA: carboxypeptidase regulatory-like domain-containing protein [Pyrinomonadaceae bacterium]|jgi:uncharacterized delta-60 repeat protein|nr:carboxypeptidase regulatory-like domain-containing protein [Pyrinomonadaceae bacterium]
MKLKILFLAIVLFSLTSIINAAPGQFDPTFNGTGKLISGQSFPHTWVTKNLAIQPDGKILAGGWNLEPFLNRGTLVRYNPSGALDTTFGNNGSVDLIFPGDVRVFPSEIKMQSDGKIVMAVNAMNVAGCGVMRLNADGSADSSFGTGGISTMTVPGESCMASGLAIQNDGRYVVMSKIINPIDSQASFALMRFMPDGTPDNTFGGDGQLNGGTQFSSDRYRSLLLQPDGKLIIVGETDVMSKHILYRFNGDGTADNSFGTNGRAIIGVGEQCVGSYSAALQPDGKIILAGGGGGMGSSCVVAAGQVRFGFEMMRLNADGSPDPTFGTNGYVFTPEADKQIKIARGLAIQPDGRILLGGSATYQGVPYPGYSYADIAVARYSVNGVLEGSSSRSKFFDAKFSGGESLLGSIWGMDGIVRARLFDNVQTGVGQIEFDAAGRLVVYGAYNVDGVAYPGMALARFQGEASPYSSITGRITTAGGVPIKNISVVLSEGELAQPRYALTNQFGYYTFSDLPVTETYSVSISSKRFNFSVDQQRLMLNHDEQSVDFTAEP